MTPQQIYNPYIDHDAEPVPQRSTWHTYLGTAALVIFMTFITLIATACDHTAALRDEQNSATAHYPSKPNYEQQTAYREDEREQLRLRIALK